MKSKFVSVFVSVVLAIWKFIKKNWFKILVFFLSHIGDLF